MMPHNDLSDWKHLLYSKINTYYDSMRKSTLSVDHFKIAALEEFRWFIRERSIDKQKLHSEKKESLFFEHPFLLYFIVAKLEKAMTVNEIKTILECAIPTFTAHPKREFPNDQLNHRLQKLIEVSDFLGYLPLSSECDEFYKILGPARHVSEHVSGGRAYTLCSTLSCIKISLKWVCQQMQQPDLTSAEKKKLREAYIVIENSQLSFELTLEEKKLTSKKFDDKGEILNRLIKLMKQCYLQQNGSETKANTIFGDEEIKTNLFSILNELSTHSKKHYFFEGASQKTLDFCKDLLAKYKTLSTKHAAVSQVRTEELLHQPDSQVPSPLSFIAQNNVQRSHVVSSVDELGDIELQVMASTIK